MNLIESVVAGPGLTTTTVLLGVVWSRKPVGFVDIKKLLKLTRINNNSAA